MRFFLDGGIKERVQIDWDLSCKNNIHQSEALEDQQNSDHQCYLIQKATDYCLNSHIKHLEHEGKRTTDKVRVRDVLYFAEILPFINGTLVSG